MLPSLILCPSYASCQFLLGGEKITPMQGNANRHPPRPTVPALRIPEIPRDRQDSNQHTNERDIDVQDAEGTPIDEAKQWMTFRPKPNTRLLTVDMQTPQSMEHPKYPVIREGMAIEGQDERHDGGDHTNMNGVSSYKSGGRNAGNAEGKVEDEDKRLEL
ncbi:uncharacterized protein BDZ99DRAFT_523136 [Mytilinidion resinicola]|uniref:Uncharacterized protein n=1 Tax=Mytilinidion resinicola TaxID=574789 RepID=A0A6A6YHP9_9PEZI|nr:uncharacterized protein BDZ99DRAFT_523136 [Mytilinidion resinicola]KAF2807525.1 hypothetical protein BDZ99DRAFT_523136 [Mytilinidion resinicola]